jgi:hypothetical protein
MPNDMLRIIRTTRPSSNRRTQIRRLRWLSVDRSRPELDAPSAGDRWGTAAQLREDFDHVKRGRGTSAIERQRDMVAAREGPKRIHLDPDLESRRAAGEWEIMSRMTTLAVLLTGPPGVGKSSVLDRLVTLLEIDGVKFGGLESEQLGRGAPVDIRIDTDRRAAGDVAVELREALRLNGWAA